MDAQSTKPQEQKRKKKKNHVNLNGYLEKEIIVKFKGGRQVTGLLKGYDQLFNLVIDQTSEQLRDEEDPYVITDKNRKLGLVVCRGTNVTAIIPTNGLKEIANPFDNPVL